MYVCNRGLVVSRSLPHTIKYTIRGIAYAYTRTHTRTLAHTHTHSHTLTYRQSYTTVSDYIRLHTRACVCNTIAWSRAFTSRDIA